MLLNLLVDRVVSTRGDVMSFESGAVGLDKLLKEAHLSMRFDGLSLTGKVVDVYAVLHRVEAAAKAYKGKKVPAVREAADEAKKLEPIIDRLLKEIPVPDDGASDLDQAGYIFLVSELNRGLRIIMDLLPAWGY